MSPLRDALDRYIAMRRGFGYKLRCEAYLLARFVAYMEQHGAAIITTSLALDWATSEASPFWAVRTSIVLSGVPILPSSASGAELFTLTMSC